MNHGRNGVPLRPLPVQLDIKASQLVFYGEHETSVDDKGRVIIPARLRDAARAAEGAVGFMMTLGEDGCITIYTPRRWKEIEAAVNSAPQKAESSRRRRRLLFTQAAEGDCDRQGRMRVPASLLAEASITHDAVIVGVSDQMELWDRERWRAYRAEMLNERGRDAEAYPL